MPAVLRLAAAGALLALLALPRCDAVRPSASDLVIDAQEVTGSAEFPEALSPQEVLLQQAPGLLDSEIAALEATTSSTTTTTPPKRRWSVLGAASAAAKAVISAGAKMVSTGVNTGAKIVSTGAGAGAKFVNTVRNVTARISSSTQRVRKLRERFFDLKVHWRNLTKTALNQGFAITRRIEGFAERAGELMLKANATAAEMGDVIFELKLLDEQWTKVTTAVAREGEALKNATGVVSLRERELETALGLAVEEGNRTLISSKLTMLRSDWGSLVDRIHLQGATLYQETMDATTTITDLVSAFSTNTTSVWKSLVDRMRAVQQRWANLATTATNNEFTIRNATATLLQTSYA